MPYPVMPHFEFSDRPASEVEAGAGIGGALPARPGFACCGTAPSLWRSLYMSLRAHSYRQRAAEAKDRATQAKDPSIKSAFENVAAGWVALPEQVERIDREKPPVRDQENNRSVR
jgi:hypothetical protein